MWRRRCGPTRSTERGHERKKAPQPERPGCDRLPDLREDQRPVLVEGGSSRTQRQVLEKSLDRAGHRASVGEDESHQHHVEHDPVADEPASSRTRKPFDDRQDSRHRGVTLNDDEDRLVAGREAPSVQADLEADIVRCGFGDSESPSRGPRLLWRARTGSRPQGVRSRSGRKR